MRGARGSSCARSSAWVVCSDSASAGFTRPGQPLEHAQVADGGKHQVLVADRARGAEQVDRFEHVIQVVRGLAHAHEHDLLHGAAACGPAPPGRRFRRCRAGAAGRPGRSCRTRSRPRSRPGWTRTGRRAAAARFPPSGHRPVPPAGAPSHPRRMFGAQPRQAASSSMSAGSASRSACGRKVSMLRRPLLCGRACAHRRSTRCSWSGPAPRRAQALAQVFDQHGGIAPIVAPVPANRRAVRPGNRPITRPNRRTPETPGRQNTRRRRSPGRRRTARLRRPTPIGRVALRA